MRRSTVLSLPLQLVFPAARFRLNNVQGSSLLLFHEKKVFYFLHHDTEYEKKARAQCYKTLFCP